MKELNNHHKTIFLKVAASIRIKVEYLGFIKNLLNKRSEEFNLAEGTSLRNLLGRLSDLYGKPFKSEIYEPGHKDMKYGFVVTVNGVLMGQLEGVETRLKGGDHVILMSLMSGG
ncbi:MAG: MoaD/ThiS family protein [Candidatus Bathyarchaeota archaeon]|nr:MoaD/ThiS family protein [Candidatus Bathyarchaeota archaeon]